MGLTDPGAAPDTAGVTEAAGAARERMVRVLKKRADDLEHHQSEWDAGVACNPFLVPDSCESLDPRAICAYFDTNPVHGLISFDNCGVAMMQLVQVA